MNDKDFKNKLEAWDAETFTTQICTFFMEIYNDDETHYKHLIENHKQEIIDEYF